MLEIAAYLINMAAESKAASVLASACTCLALHPCRMHCTLTLVLLPVPVACSFCEDEDSAPAVTPADYAALTSSQQLTHLDLTHDPGPEHAAVLFPAQHQLPKLQSLALGIQWLEDAEVLGRIITCCPNLQALKVNSYGGADVSDIDSAVWAASSSRLTALSELTTLQLMMLEVSVGADVGAALAALTGLRELSNDTMNSEDVPALQQLTACQQLTMLYVESMSFGESPSPADDGVLIVNQVRAVLASSARPT